MSYRPICDVWILARSKVKFYGAYPAGFLHRARALLGVSNNDPVLHACAGKIKDYPYRGFGPNDRTLDLDPATHPDFCQDARDPWPCPSEWAAVLADPPYTEADAEQYACGSSVLPSANEILRRAFEAVCDGGRVGLLHYVWPQPPKGVKEVAVVAVGTGRNNRARWYTVWERE